MNDKIHGIEEEFYANGNIKYKTPHIFGKKYGIAKKFYNNENGNISRITLYIYEYKHGI